MTRKPSRLTVNNKGTMFSLCSKILGCNHDPVSFGRSSRVGLFEPLSRDRRGMGASAWDALGHFPTTSAACSGPELRLRGAVKGGVKYARNPQACAAGASAD